MLWVTVNEKLEITKYKGLMCYLYSISYYDKNWFEGDKYSVHTAENQANGAIAYLGVEWEMKLAL